MAVTHLLERLDSPNSMSRNYTYEPHRDLVATLNDKRGTTAVVNRSYTYNALGIPTNRTIQRQGTTRNDTFTHNDRNELTAATMGADNYAYDYDNIGNRKTAQETANEFTYEANALNQYTQITENDVDFTPAFDLDGNQTRIKTATGIWTAVYNALNRPVRFEKADGSVVITADYDYMGRRVFKKVETNNTVTSHLRFLYRGYLQIAALDLTRAMQNAMWLITWDPTEPVATRPLAIQQSGTWYTYGIDLPKNVTELYGTNGYIVTAYTYSPYGLITSTGSVTQPIQWSSEYADTDLCLVYYNYRHYNPLDGRWTGRDSVKTISIGNRYMAFNSRPELFVDYLGLKETIKNTDSFGNECQTCKMKQVTVYVLKPFTKGHVVGHTFIDCPTVGCRGKYPSKCPVVSPGIIKDDGSLKDEYIHTGKLSVVMKLSACPESIRKLAKIIRSEELNCGLYCLSSAQCTNWVYRILKEAGADIPDVPGALFDVPTDAARNPISKESSKYEKEQSKHVTIFKLQFSF